MSNRAYTSRRMAIVDALVEKIKEINGNTPYRSNLYSNVKSRLLFWDEVQDFPAVHLSAGPETREYQGGGYKDRFMTVTVRVYVQEEDAMSALEILFEDLETVLEDNSRLQYTDQDNVNQYAQQITILSISSDEGALEPLGVGEIICQVRY
jgi:hypothetical protein